MRTVLAFEPDHKQAAALKLVVRDRVGAEFVHAESKDAALAAIRNAVPDLILLTALISPRDETEIADLIRELDGAEHTQTLTIPLLDLGTSKPVKKKKRGLLSALTGETDTPSAPAGCDPKVFADEIANYLVQAEHAKADAAAMRERRAKKPKRKKKETAVDAAVEAEPTASSSGYWSWDAPLPSPAAEASPVTAEPEPPQHAAPAESAPPVDVDSAAQTTSSSWANPWDVSAPSIWKEPVASDPALKSADTFLDDHVIPADAQSPEPEPFVAAPTEAIDALLEQPAAITAADHLASAGRTAAPTLVVTPEEVQKPVVEALPGAEAPMAFEATTAPALIPAQEIAPQPADSQGESESTENVEPEIVRAKLPTRAESGALLALQADVARLRLQRASTDATLVAAKAAQERAAKAASEAAEHAKREADRRAEEAASRAREEARAERRARELAEKRAQEEAERRAEAERKARENAERLAREAADRAREEAAARARQEAAAERRAREEAERKAREEAARLVEAERKAREEAERRAEAERKARQESERRAKEENARLEREARERQAHAEAERKAREAAEAHAAAERNAREQAERRAREEAERLAREAERKAHQEADKRAKLAEQAAKEHGMRLAKEAKEGEARAKQEAAAERAAKEQAARLSKEAEARAREEAAVERRARQQAEQRAEAERQARVEVERRAEAEREERAKAELEAKSRTKPSAETVKAKPVRKGKKAAPEPKRAAKGKGSRAVQDEWGLYDPHAAGFEALFAKLESIENGEVEPEPEPVRAKSPRPLAMWAFQYDAMAGPPAVPAKRTRDLFRALVSEFSIPHAVAAVSYANGARIRSVKVRAVKTRRARAATDPKVVILSRKLLKAARKQGATERLTARR